MSSEARLIKRYLSDILLGIVFPISITCFLLSPIIILNGVPFYGDETYYRCDPNSFYFNSFNWFFEWTSAHGPAPPFLTLFSYSVPLTLLVNLLGQESAVKCFILVIASLPGILTYFALKILSREWSLFGDKVSAKMFSLTGALFMLLSFTNAGLIGGATTPAWSYSLLPISLAFFVRYLNRGSLRDLLLLCISSLFAIANPFWIYLMVIMVLVYLSFEVAASRQRLSILKRTTVALSFILMSNAFWLVPTVSGYLLGAGGTFSSYATEKLISLGGLRFLSHWNLLDVMMAGEHQYYFFWLHPQNYGPLNAIIPIIATSSILMIRKNRYVLFMAMTLVIGLFLTKGVWEPGGYLYYLMAKSLPYGAGAILRNPTKFSPLVTFSYAFLIGLFIAKIYEKLQAKSRRYGIYRYFKPALVGGLALLVLTPITYGTLLDLRGYTWPRFKPTYIPEVYDDINSWLHNQDGDYKVMWTPSGGSYMWKPYIITAFPDLYSSKPAVSFRKIYPEPLKSTDRVGEVLSLLGVKYVIFHGDSLDYPNDEILKLLEKQRDLKPVLFMNYTYLPEDKSKAPLPVGTNGIEFENVPFKMASNNSKLCRGVETNITLYYKIPDFVVRQGFKGKFWAGFSIRLWGLPAGSFDPNEKVFESFVSDQVMINETSGYASFKVKIPYNCPEAYVDIYANIYDGSFKPLTPSYFIARLPIYPRGIRLPFIVFENEAYRGQVFVIQNTSKSADILSYRQVSPVEHEVIVNSSGPFVLVFTEPYDRLWRAYVNGREIEPVPIQGMVNGFRINETGVLNIRLYYTLQNYYNAGWIISLTTFIACTAYLAHFHTTIRRLLRRVKQRLKR